MNKNKDKINTPTYAPADFFVLRSPRLSLKHLTDWQGKDRTGLRQGLIAWLEQVTTKEALHIASPALLARISDWYTKPDSKKGKKIELALAKYFIRMSGRATPFGMFSGNSLGKVAEHTVLKVSNNAPVHRKSRLDMHYLASTQKYLRQGYWLSNSLDIVLNPTAYKTGNQIRYIESYVKAEETHYRLSSVEACPYVTAVYARGVDSAKIGELADIICSVGGDISFNDATDFMEQLIEAGLLLPKLPLPITGSSPDESLLKSITDAEFDEHAQMLATVIKSLNFIDSKSSVDLKDYKNATSPLRALPVPVNENKLIQVDYFREGEELTLSNDLCKQAIDDVLLLNSLLPSPENPLQELITKVEREFVGKMIPLQEFIDDESGWSMSNDIGFSTPLLQGIGLTQTQKSDALTSVMTPFERKIVEKMTCLSDEFVEQITFSKEELKYCAVNQQPLPDSVAVMLQLYKNDADELDIYYRGSFGPSAANFLGRFCHLDDTLESKTKALLKLEETQNPQAIYAEIVHLPQGRLGNVIARPVLREHEIPIVGDSGVSEEFQISLSDLYVYVESNTVKLWSKALDKEIIPRLSSAHNYTARSLGVYRFLCMLQNQNISLPRFALPSALESVSYLPRIKLEGLVLSNRRWIVERKVLSNLLAGNGELDEAKYAKFKEQFNLPNWVSYSVSDNTLLLNLSNPIMLDILLSETTGQERIALEEVMDFRYDSAATLDDAPLKHEVILPLIKSSEGVAADKEKNEHRKRIIEQDTTRSFSPGSEWLSVKVYLGNSSAESLLKERIAPLVAELKRDSLINGFFFLRYGDPEWHLRLRFKGEPKVLLSQVLPKLHQLIEPIRLSGPVNNIVIDTYEQEVERYGGGAAIELAEQLFYANSLMTLDFIRAIEGQEDDYRWRAVLLACDQLLSDFGFNLEQKLALTSLLREGFGREFGDSGNLRKDLGKKYRQYQDIIASDLSQNTADVVITHCKKQLADYSQTVQQIASRYAELEEQDKLTESLDSVVSSMLHMFNNRMFVAYGREQEFVVYDLLRRYYESAVHRSHRS